MQFRKPTNLQLNRSFQIRGILKSKFEEQFFIIDCGGGTFILKTKSIESHESKGEQIQNRIISSTPQQKNRSQMTGVMQRLVEDEKKRKEKMNSILEMSLREQSEVFHEKIKAQGSFDHFLKQQQEWEYKKNLKISSMIQENLKNSYLGSGITPKMSVNKASGQQQQRATQPVFERLFSAQKSYIEQKQNQMNKVDNSALSTRKVNNQELVERLYYSSRNEKQERDAERKKNQSNASGRASSINSSVSYTLPKSQKLLQNGIENEFTLFLKQQNHTENGNMYLVELPGMLKNIGFLLQPLVEQDRQLAKNYVKLLQKYADEESVSCNINDLEQQNMSVNEEGTPQISKKSKQIANKKLDDVLKQKKEEDELQGVTFKPEIIKSYRPKGNLTDACRSPTSNLSSSRFDSLYQKALEKPEKRDRNIDEIKFEQEKDHFTFKPQREKPALFVSQRNPDQREPLYNMKQALSPAKSILSHIQPKPKTVRQKNAASRPNTAKKIYVQTQEDDEGNSLFYIDVNVNSSKKRIVFRENDVPESVASIFCNKYDMSMEQQQILIKKLKQQLQSTYHH
ncbi:UNKNOWN [Stylonychia lemnae]|uniref:Uncharacterized protein n=1 Tax=Stylonychia lemnae TaxID=5949 RepID=A0A078AU23_STYLE|nr:UNKNOWN [Stylonychia lemnae]|eukprot:CDW84353.1 UNKNOWN [Stylonychia lemnae]